MDRLISAIKEKGYSSVGLADHQVLFGVPEFATLSKKHSIQSIIGLDIVYSKMLVTFFAVNEQGYRQLIQLSHLAQEGLINNHRFQNKNKEIIAVISPLQSSIFKEPVDQIALYISTQLAGIESTYIGIESYQDSDAKMLQQYREFAKKYTYPTVAFPHIRYGKANDAIILDILQAIHRGETLTIKDKLGSQYLPTLEEIQERYLPEEIIETINIANACRFNFFVKRGQLLSFQSATSSQDLLREKSIEGLQSRPIDFTQMAYLERLDYELTMIEQLGFADYFLIVADFIQFAKQQRIMVGPGRGSAPGSLVAYALGITEIDPLPHQLLFERFLNPSRKTMPDIDTDFADKDRE
jgi:DNA polymerase-3 subunit alpha